MSKVHESMVQPRGAAYRTSALSDKSHYPDPIDDTPGRLAGNSRIWGDASPEVQSRAIDALIAASERAGLSVRQTAHVLAIARVESGFNPDAAAGTSSATGLGQFIDKTGAAYGISDANRGDVNKQAEALVAHFRDNLELATRRGQGEEYLYKYHHDGPSKDYGGLGLSRAKVMPYIGPYETFVRDHRLERGLAIEPPTKDDGLQVTPPEAPSGPADRFPPGRSHESFTRNEVLAVQKDLNTLHFTDSRDQRLKEDGVPGPRTTEAIAAFQLAKGLPITGRPDDVTREAIHAYAVVASIEQRRTERSVAPDALADAPALSAKERGQVLTFLDAGHADHRLYRTVREHLPAYIGDDKVAEVTLAARQGGVRTWSVDAVGIHGDRIFVFGTGVGAQAFVDARSPAPTIDHTMRQSDAFDRQQDLQREQAAAVAERQEAAMVL